MVNFQSDLEEHWRNICESTSPEVTPNKMPVDDDLDDDDVLDGLGSVDNPSPLESQNLPG